MRRLLLWLEVGLWVLGVGLALGSVLALATDWPGSTLFPEEHRRFLPDINLAPGTKRIILPPLLLGVGFAALLAALILELGRRRAADR